MSRAIKCAKLLLAQRIVVTPSLHPIRAFVFPELNELPGAPESAAHGSELSSDALTEQLTPVRTRLLHNAQRALTFEQSAVKQLLTYVYKGSESGLQFAVCNMHVIDRKTLLSKNKFQSAAKKWNMEVHGFGENDKGVCGQVTHPIDAVCCTITILSINRSRSIIDMGCV